MAQTAPAAAQGRPAFDLAQATVTALTMAASIEQSIDRIDRNRLGDQSGRFEATSEARRALGRSQEASSLLGKPIGAPDSPVRKAAAAMRAPFSQLSTTLNDAIRIWEKLDRAADENETVDLVRSSVALLANEAPWDRMQQATIGVTQALLDPNRAGRPAAHESRPRDGARRSQEVIPAIEHDRPGRPPAGGGRRHSVRVPQPAPGKRGRPVDSAPT